MEKINHLTVLTKDEMVNIDGGFWLAVLAGVAWYLAENHDEIAGGWAAGANAAR